MSEYNNQILHAYESRRWNSITNTAKLTHFNESVTVMINIFEIIFLASKNLFFCNLSNLNSMKDSGTGKHWIRSTEYIGWLSLLISTLKVISITVYSEMILIFHCIHKHSLVINIVHESISDFEIHKSVNWRDSPFLKNWRDRPTYSVLLCDQLFSTFSEFKFKFI